MEAVLACACVPLLVAVVWLAVSSPGLARAAYAQGKRDALRLAIDLAVQRGEVAVQISPEGSQLLGLQRAQALHALELDLRAELSEVNR